MESNLSDSQIRDGIRKYYLIILEREPDNIGLEYYVNKIKNQEIKLESLPITLKNSPEYKELQKKKGNDTTSLQEILTININNSSYNINLISKKIDDHKIYLNRDDDPLRMSFSQESIYEKTTVTFLKKLLKKGMNVINIGANIGYFTLLMAREVGSTGKVFSFEPLPLTVKLLQKNVDANGYKNVEIIPKAVSNKNGKLDLCVAPSIVHNFVSSKDMGLQKLSIEGITIDRFLEDKKIKIDLVMMDAEGSEKYVLEGMEKTLHNNPDLEIITEYNPYAFELVDTTGKAFLNMVEKLGFSVFLIDENEDKIKPVTKDELLKLFVYPRYTNIYLTKSPDKMSQ